MRRAEVFRISLQKKKTTTPQKHIALYYNSTSISQKNKKIYITYIIGLRYLLIFILKNNIIF